MAARSPVLFFKHDVDTPAGEQIVRDELTNAENALAQARRDLVDLASESSSISDAPERYMLMNLYRGQIEALIQDIKTLQFALAGQNSERSAPGFEH